MTMTSASRTIAKNAGVMLVSQAVTWGLTLIVTILVPRYLGATGLGRWQIAVSAWAFMSIIISFGMDTLLAKEIAREPSRTSSLLSTSVLLRTCIFVASLGLMIVYMQAADYSLDTKEIILIVGLSTVIWQINFAYRAALQGLEHLEFNALSEVAAKAFSAALAVVLLLNGYGLVMFALVDVGAALISLIVLHVALNRIHVTKSRLEPQKLVWMLKASFPYLMLTGFMVAYGQIDILVVSFLVSEQQIGWYGAATRLATTFGFIPSVLMTALLPAFSRMHTNASDSLGKLMSKSFDLLVLATVPIGLGVMSVANQFILLLYGSDFANSGPIMATMGVVLIFFSLNMLFAQFFISNDRQNMWIVVMAVGTVITIPLDFVLVPLCQSIFGIGALGGALSYLVTEAGMLVFGLFALPKGVLGWKNGWLALRVILASLAMVAVVWVVRDYFIVIPIGIGMLVYLVCIVLLRVMSSEDWALLGNLGRAAFRRIGLSRQPPASSTESIGPVK